MEIGAAGGFMGHVLLVTGAPRRLDRGLEPSAKELERAKFKWPADAVELWIVPAIESTRHEEGLHRAELIVFVQRSTGHLRLIGEFTPSELVIEEEQESMEIWQSPGELRQQLRVDLMQDVLDEMKAYEANWSASTAARAFMQMAWGSARIASGSGTGQVLEEIHASWRKEPICTSVVVTFWQRYLCKLAQAAIITRGCLIDPSELVLKWMPLKADRVLPGELFSTMQACGWVMLQQVPKVFQPMPMSLRQACNLRDAPVFEAGELVDYWSQRHGQWIGATVLKHHTDGQGNTLSYDLDVKLCAEVCKIRKRSAAPTLPTRPRTELALPTYVRLSRMP